MIPTFLKSHPSLPKWGHLSVGGEMNGVISGVGVIGGERHALEANLDAFLTGPYCGLNKGHSWKTKARCLN